MTGPEHYDEAQRLAFDAMKLVALASDAAASGYADDFLMGADTIANIAQVHATLALAAASTGWGSAHELVR